MEDTNEALVALTADIVSAHVANNSVAVNDLPTLINNVHTALTRLGGPQQPASSKREPAVSVRSSVKPEAITCLICGTRHKMLKRHLSTAHDISPQEYRSEFDLKADYPMVAPDYAETRRNLAKKHGLGTKRKGTGKAKGGSAKVGGRAGKADTAE